MLNDKNNWQYPWLHNNFNTVPFSSDVHRIWKPEETASSGEVVKYAATLGKLRKFHFPFEYIICIFFYANLRSLNMTLITQARN